MSWQLQMIVKEPSYLGTALNEWGYLVDSETGEIKKVLVQGVPVEPQKPAAAGPFSGVVNLPLGEQVDLSDKPEAEHGK